MSGVASLWMRLFFAMPRRVFSAAARLTRGPRQRWKDLVCEHMPIHSRAAIGFTQPTPEETAHIRPVRHRLVSVHPATGRKSLFLSSHAGAILGWTIPEARMFLRDLAEHATQREFVHVHRWRPGDLVMWDNRTTMQRARRFGSEEIRDVRRTTLAGDAPAGELATA